MEAQWHIVSLRLQVNPPTLSFHPGALKESMNIGLHLMRCLANTQGPKIRVNAVSPPSVLGFVAANVRADSTRVTTYRMGFRVPTGEDRGYEECG